MTAIISSITTLIIFILIIGLLVFIHELGHYIVARMIDAKVEEFALGLGPILFKKRVGETDYMIKLFPIGGYVKILGETDEEKSSDPRSLSNKSPIKRIAVMCAGVIMNLILASFLYYFVLSQNEYKVYLANSFQNFNPIAADVYKEKISKTQYVQFTELAKDGGAKISGMFDKGYIKSIDKQDVVYSQDIPDILKNNLNKYVEVVACKDENCADSSTYNVKVSSEGKIGISIAPNYVTVLSYEKNKGISGLVHGINIVKLSVIGMSDIFSQAKVSGDYTKAVNTLSGPVGIFLAIDKLKEFGFIAVVSLCADLSLVLGVMNLLPIPALDGGRIVLTLPEAITGKPLNSKLEALLINISFILLLILMFVVFVKDIVFFKYIKDLLK